MNALVTTDEISKCTDVEALGYALTDAVGNLLDDIMRIAAIVRRLDELGAAVEFDNSILPYIRMVGSGKLLGTVLAGLYGEPLLLEQAVAADLDVQERMIAGEFEVLMPDGSVSLRMTCDLSPKQIRQVFKNGKVRSIEQQQDWLRASVNKSVANKAIHKDAAAYKEIQVRRCSGCGARLVDDSEGECLKCQNDLLAAVNRSDDEQEAVDQSDESDDEELVDGWQDRMLQLRQAKQSGDEVGFHVSWLVEHLQTRDSPDAVLRPLYLRLRELFESTTDALLRRSRA